MSRARTDRPGVARTLSASRRPFSADRYPASTARALDQLVVAASSDPRPWALAWARRERTGLAPRHGRRWLWGASPEAPEAFLWAERFPGVGIALGAFVVDPGRPEPTLRELVRWFDHPRRGGPVVRFSEWVPGLSAGRVHRALAALRFRWVSRVDYSLPGERALPEAPTPPGVLVRPVRASDARGLASLHLEAYRRDPVESALFRERRTAEADAREAVRGLFRHLGTFRAEASFVADDDGRLVAASCVNDFHGPLISQVMVHPDYRRRGLGRYLVVRSAEAIRQRGPDVPRLVVTETNRPAVALYRSLGFEVDSSTRGAIGVRESFIRWVTASGSTLRPRRR